MVPTVPAATDIIRKPRRPTACELATTVPQKIDT
jgi:hypothetical protein